MQKFDHAMIMFSPEEIASYAKRLEQMETELSEALKSNSDSTAPVELDSSIGRLSRIDAIQSQQIALGLKARQQQALLRVRNALQAISSGLYGHCRRCKGQISRDRLEAEPDAVFCVKCAGSPRA